MPPTISHPHHTRASERGAITLLVIGFIGVLGMMITALSGYAILQAKYGRAMSAREQALHAAEAGLEYYRWFIEHNPSIRDTGAGIVSPYTYTLEDPEGGEVGSATISATPHILCGSVQWIDLVATGTASVDPKYTRTLSVRYMKRSVAEYSYIVDTDVVAFSDRTIRGPYHSNGGVRMDATHNSDVTSAVPTWNCTTSYSCNPEQPNAPGVVGNGSNPTLWHYPEDTISFAVIGVDFDTFKSKARYQGGIYYASSTGAVSERGYHLIFNSNGTVTVKRVTDTSCVDSQSSQYGWGSECSIINSETTLGTYAIPASCPLIFANDRVWVEGTVKGKVTVVAASPGETGTSPDAYLKNNILYSAYDGTDGITIMAERNVLLPLQSPSTMTINGIFVAQSGHYGRDYFTTSGSHDVPSAYDSYVLQDTLNTTGTVVSSGRTGTAWKSSGNYVSGYVTRNDFYDQLLSQSPPPFTPAALPTYQYALWREM